MITPVVNLSLYKKLNLLTLAAINPSLFAEEEKRHNTEMNDILMKQPPTQLESNIHTVRTALYISFITCGLATLIGSGVGATLFFLVGSRPLIATFAIVGGTAILLWATLAVQGWSIQSMKGQTLTERVNQWIFRSLYASGTGLISLGSLWAVL